MSYDKHMDCVMDQLLARLKAEGRRDHERSAVRFKGLQEAVNRFCPPDAYEQIMAFVERCEEKYMAEDDEDFDKKYPSPREYVR